MFTFDELYEGQVYVTAGNSAPGYIFRKVGRCKGVPVINIEKELYTNDGWMNPKDNFSFSSFEVANQEQKEYFEACEAVKYFVPAEEIIDSKPKVNNDYSLI